MRKEVENNTGNIIMPLYKFRMYTNLENSVKLESLYVKGSVETWRRHESDDMDDHNFAMVST